ncbi:MAG: DUF4397 domain-containing protein [Bacteroidota bacterium]
MKKNHLNVFAISGILLMGILFTACKKSNFENTNPEVAGLMAFNLAPDQSVAIGISGNALTSSPLGFTSYTGGYLGIYPGNRTVESYNYASGDSIATASYDFTAKKYYSLFVVGSNDNYQNVIVNDNFDSLSSSSGQAYIRYINAINGSASPQVTITANGTNVVNSNAAFAGISEFVAVAPGPVAITVNEGSTVNANRTITVEQKKVYTVLLASGATSADPAQIKYVVNGTLEDEAVSGQRISSAQVVNIK